MPNCPHCSRYSAPPVKWICKTCGCTWCSNGNCPGRDGKKGGKNTGLKCPSCRKGKIDKI